MLFPLNEIVGSLGGKDFDFLLTAYDNVKSGKRLRVVRRKMLFACIFGIKEK
jgi:hypothetical protein